MTNVGFIGVGTMGGPMVKRLLDAKYKVYAIDKNQSALKEVAKKGAIIESTYSDLAKRVKVIILSLPDSDIVESVIYPPGDLLNHVRPGTVVIDMGTSDPSSTVKIAADLSKHGANMLDAPVSGGPKGATEGTLSCMVGGSATALQEVMHILNNLATQIHYIGESGTGHSMKLINNMVGIGNLVLLCEVLSIAEKLGIDLETTVDVMKGGSPRSFALDMWGERLVAKEYDSVAFRFDLAAKDVRLAQTLSAKSLIPYPMFASVHQVFAASSVLGLEKKDICAVKTMWDKLISLNTQ